MDKNKCNYYTCLHCGKTVHKAHKLMHDLKCNESKKKSIKNKNNYNHNNHKYNNNHSNHNSNKNQIIYNYKCEICGIKMNIKEKSDHLFCHELEKNEINIKNENKEKKEIKVGDVLNFSFHNINDSIDYNNQNYNNNINNNININERSRNIYNILNNNRNNNNNIIIPNYINNNNINVRRRRRNSMEYIRTGILHFTHSSSSSSSDYISRYISNSSSDSEDSFKYNYNNEVRVNDIINKNCVVSKIKRTNKLSEDKKKCLICLEKFKKGDNIIILPCIHIFHSDCIRNWMKKQITCPLCKCKIDNKK